MKLFSTFDLSKRFRYAFFRQKRQRNRIERLTWRFPNVTKAGLKNLEFSVFRVIRLCSRFCRKNVQQNLSITTSDLFTNF